MRIADREYEVIDAIENITVADSFLRRNKLATFSGHGEAKLYVGNESDFLKGFFNDYGRCDCFFLKSDFAEFLEDAKPEYMAPQQEYKRKDKMREDFKSDVEKLESFDSEYLTFTLIRSDVNPPRVYMANPQEECYDFMRDIALTNISYLSVLKLKDLTAEDEHIVFYFKLFLDYDIDIEGYVTTDDIEEIAIEESSLSTEEKKELKSARKGQGKYRQQMLEDCPFCPFTMVNDERLLIASHAKPWRDSSDTEKIDPKNGFILTPTYDKLFDKGFITFNEDKTVSVSPWISPMNQKRLNIKDGMKLPNLPLDDKRLVYLKYHQEKVFKG